MTPTYFIFLGLGAFAACIAVMLGYSDRKNLSIVSTLIAAFLMGWGAYLYSQEPAPCGGMEEITRENVECVIYYSGHPIIDK
jgi:hypothetical protein